MRVIAGEFRSRVLKTLPGLDVRPTPDRLRESLFNILAPRMAGIVFLDAYAGTGSVGIEALSRGARHVIFIERSRSAALVIHENLKSLRAEAQAEVVQNKSAAVLSRYRADVVFLDPPYHLDKEYDAALEALGEAPPPLVIVQHDKHKTLPERIGKLHQSRVVRQGDNCLTFYEPEEAGVE